MREIRTSSSMRGRRKRATAQRACALLYRSPWLVSLLVAVSITELDRGDWCHLLGHCGHPRHLSATSPLLPLAARPPVRSYFQ
jgi:hypothetical protein